MLRKALMAVAAISVLASVPSTASARGFGGFGGGFHGGGFHGGGGWHGGGWHGGGWGWGGPALGFGIGLGLAGLYGPYGYAYGYPAYAYNGCVQARRVWTPVGWRFQRVNVCY
jgi:hypothetical protein